MKQRRWDSKTKTKIVLQGLSEAHKVFDSRKDLGEVNRLRKKNQELTQRIGSLTVE